MPRRFKQFVGHDWIIILLALSCRLAISIEGSYGVIELENIANECYYTEVQVGTPSQPIKFTFSTSNHLNWLRSALGQCIDCAQSTSTIYNPQTSTTLSVTNFSSVLLYLNMKGMGNFSSDYISINGFQQQRLTPFVLVTSMKVNKSAECPTGGLFALSRDRRYKNIFSAQYDNRSMISHNFAIKYGLLQQNQKSLVYYNFSLSSFPQAFYLNLVNNDNWVIKIDSGLQLSTGTKFAISEVLIDSTSIITLLPKRIFDSLYDQSWKRYCYKLEQDHYCQYDDKTKYKFPSLSFQSQGVQFALQPFMYLGQFKPGKGCKLRIGSSNVGVLGVNFMQYYTVIFDQENKKVGFMRNQKIIKLPYISLDLGDIQFGFYVITLLLTLATLIMCIKIQMTQPQRPIEVTVETELQEGMKQDKILV